MGKVITMPEDLVRAYASTDCPRCGGYVLLDGEGSPDIDFRLSGRCPNNHLVYFDRHVADPTIKIKDLW